MDVARRQEIQGWMVAFADGDRGSFQPLFDALWPVLLSFTVKTLAIPADAEDAAQQAMIKIFSRIADFDRGRDGVGWALGMTAYEVMTVRKARARRREGGSAGLDQIAHDSTDIEAHVIADELRQAAVAVAGELPAHDREALHHLFTGEPSSSDERSRKRRFRALQRLRAAWRRVHG